MRWMIGLATLVLVTLPLHAENKDRRIVTLVKIDDGAVLDEKEAVDGHPVADSYRLTQISCSGHSNDIRIVLPVDKNASLALADTTLKRAKGRWTMDFKAYGKDYSKKVEFRSISDKNSRVSLAAEISVNFGDPLWKALIDRSGTRFWVMNGGLGTNVAVTDEAELAKFLAACHLGNK